MKRMFKCKLPRPFPIHTLDATSRGQLYLHVTSSLTSLHPIRGWMGRKSWDPSCPSSSSELCACTQLVASPDAGNVLGYTERATCFYPQLNKAGRGSLTPVLAPKQAVVAACHLPRARGQRHSAQLTEASAHSHRSACASSAAPGGKPERARALPDKC